MFICTQKTCTCGIAGLFMHQLLRSLVPPLRRPSSGSKAVALTAAWHLPITEAAQVEMHAHRVLGGALAERGLEAHVVGGAEVPEGSLHQALQRMKAVDKHQGSRSRKSQVSEMKYYMRSRCLQVIVTGLIHG